MNHIAILFALPIEAHGLRRYVGSRHGHIGTTEVKIGVSGMGKVHAATMAAQMLSQKPSLLIVAGFAGALDEELTEGDIIVAQSVVDASVQPPIWHVCDNHLLKGTVKDVPRVFERQMLTVRHMVADTVDKTMIFDASGCAAVDMESGPAASAAYRAGISVMIVRVIVDRANQPMPEALAKSIGPNGKPRIGRLTLSILKRPPLVVHLVKVFRQSKLAKTNLTSFLIKLLEAIAAANEPVFDPNEAC